MATDDKAQKENAPQDKKPTRPAPVPRKVGEPPGNLRKREDWFRKRSGT